MARQFKMPGYLIWPLRITSGVITLLLFALGGGLWWLSTDSGRGYVENIVQNELSAAIGYQIQTRSLRIRFPLTAAISRISLADPEGVWLEAENVSIHLLPAPNILRHLVIRKIDADTLRLLRSPEGPATSGDGNGAGMDISVLGVGIRQALLASKATGLPQDVIGTVSGSIGLAASAGGLAFQVNSHISQAAPGLDAGDFSASGLYLLKDSRVDFETLQFSNPKFAASASGSINLASREIKAELKADQLKLEQWREGVTGAATLDASIAGTVESPIINAMIRTQDVAYKQTPVPGATTSATISRQENTWLGSIHIDAADDGEARANYRLSETTLDLKDIAARYFKSEITGNLQIDLETFLAGGILQAKIPEIQQFSLYFPEPVNGRANISAALSSRLEKQAATLVFDLQNIKVRGAALSAATVEMDFSNLATAEPDNIKSNLTNAQYADITFNRAVLEASRKGQHWQATFIGDGNAGRPFSINTSGELSVTAATGVVAKLTAFTGAYGKIAFDSLAPIALFAGKDRQSVSAPALKIGSGELTLEAALKNKAVSATATGKNILISQFGSDLPAEIEDSQLAFALKMNGSHNGPRVELDANLTGARFFDTSPESLINAKAILQNGKMDIRIVTDNTSPLRSNINARLPVNFSLDPFIMSLEENSPIDGDADIALNITALSTMLLPPEHVLKGTMRAKLALSGSIAAPQINGQIKLDQGAYNFLPLGVSLQKISATITADNQSFTLMQFHAEDAKANSLTAAGKADFTSVNAYAYDLRIGAKHLALINHPSARGVISGDLTMKGDTQSGVIAGQIKSETLNIFLPDRFVGDVPVLNIVATIPDSAKPEKPQTGAIADKSPIVLDVTLQAENKVFVRGWGIDAELKGQLHLTGNILDPAIRGKFTTLRGRYEEFGKRFKLQQAELLFEGDIPPSPYLNVIAATTESGVEIRPVITGPIREPALKIESTPAMPQDEALSILLFGKNSTKISPVQAVQLANSLRKLSGKGGGGFDPAGTVRNLLGVDDFNINGGVENGAGASVGIGKYIGDNIYLEVESGAQTGNGKARIEVQVAPNISVESSTGATGDNNVGVNWKHDY